MKVSFITPTYNCDAYLAEAVKSVLNQSYLNIEHVVVNDGSTDTTDQLMEYFVKKDDRVKYFKKDNTGAADSLNYGMERATGDIILLADADDVQEREKAHLYIRALEEADWAHSGYYYCDTHAKIHDVIKVGEVTLENLRKCTAICGASIGFRRSLYDNGLRFRPELRVNYDLGMMIDLYKLHTTFVAIDAPTFRYRVLPTGMSYSKKEEVDRITEELIKELDDER